MIATRLRLACALCALSVVAPAAFADTAAIHASRDNTLYESATGSLSNGAGSGIFAGDNASGFLRRALVYFPVADFIPAGSTIQSAVLQLHLERRQDVSVNLHLHPLLASWGEGASVAVGNGGMGIAPAPGDATWLHRFYPDVLWTALGGDFDPIPEATIAVADTGYVQWGSSPSLVDRVQSWVSDPASNFGWMIRTDENAALSGQRFDSRESSSPWYWPVLLLEYTPPVISADEARLPTLQLRLAGAAPSSGPVTFEVALPRSGVACLEIYDARGALARRLLEGPQEAGRTRVTWDGRDAHGVAVAPGVFCARLRSGAASCRVCFVRLGAP